MKEIEKEFQVTPELSAAKMGSGQLEVLATPALIAMMENTTQDLLNGVLEAGQSSVGTQIQCNHLKASAIGSSIIVKARLIKKDQRFYSFELEAFDGENMIAKGSHQRAIINVKKFMARL
ncbi:thioesterase family protein [Eremococcus coleocola]|uniref:thioesterase family protein n=1 Tax=Eremococcus coleocola TaxID=88132 RepID=UPI000418D0B8|nr:thioesterase family protein [Eremococcus coleocola]